MKTKDLRIGNLVKCVSRGIEFTCKVSEVHSECIYIQSNDDSRILGDKFLCIVNTEANYNLTSYQDSRQQATEQAIKKANDLYNSRYENV